MGGAREPAWPAGSPLPPAPVPRAPPPQARKQRRAVEQVAPLLEAAAAELDYLAEAEVMVAQAEGASHLGALLEVQVRGGGWVV